jgi:hypothetical protein
MTEVDKGAFEVKVRPYGNRPYKADLSEFALGSNARAVRKRGKWGGDYSGRPAFAMEIADFYKTVNPNRKRETAIRNALRQLFRYLDYRAKRQRDFVASCMEVRDAHGLELRQWLGGEGTAFRIIKMALNEMRAFKGGRRLFWPNRHRDQGGARELQDEEGLRCLFQALRQEARAIKAMFAEGADLASRGCDPRLLAGRKPWSSPENRAWLMHALLESGVPGGRRLREARAGALRRWPGASHLAPTMDKRPARGMAAVLRWFVPSGPDTAVFLWLFLLGTGWNPSTAVGIDVLDPDGWCQPHPQSELFTVIHAFKRRANRHQFAISKTRPEWHPYRILEYMIERSAPLRRHVLAELAETRRRRAADSKLDLDRKIERLERLCRTPWLFVNRRGREVSGFIGENDGELLEVARALAETTGLAKRYPRLGEIVTKDARQAWIGHAYVRSGYNMLLTKLAGSHGSLRSTKHYIRSHRYRAYSEEQVRKLQNAVFSDIESGRVLNPTRLRLLVAHGRITPEQEARLADYRQRTRVGMGCLDPISPPKEVDPDHQKGSLCRVQRCTGCPNGIVFPESLAPLARRYAELLHLRRTMPMTAWDDSSLADEYESIEQTLEHFDRARVSAEMDAWTDKLNSGEIHAHGTYPSY